MSDYPHVRALFAQLLSLDEVETNLPLQVLINLHRSQLREPFEVFTHIAQTRFETAAHRSLEEAVSLTLRRFNRAYPTLRGGLALTQNAALCEIFAMQKREKRQLRFLATCTAMTSVNPILGETVLAMGKVGANVAEPLLTLHLITMTEFDLQSLCEMLEAQVAADPAVEQMILDMTFEGASRA